MEETSAEKITPNLHQIAASWLAAMIASGVAHIAVLGPVLIAAFFLSDSATSSGPGTAGGSVLAMLFVFPASLVFAAVFVIALAVVLWGAMIPVSAAVLRHLAPRIIALRPSWGRSLGASAAGMSIALPMQLMSSLFLQESEGTLQWLAPLVAGVALGSLVAATIIARTASQDTDL